MIDLAAFSEAFRPGAGLPLLADALLKATVVLTLAFAAAGLLSRAPAATRHLVWTLALAGILALPVVEIVMPWKLAIVPGVPALSTAVFPAYPSAGFEAAPLQAEAAVPLHSLEAGEMDPNGAVAGPPLPSSEGRATSAKGRLAPAPKASESEAAGLRWPNLPELLVGIWFLGFGLFLAPWVAAVRTTRRLVRASVPAGAAWRGDRQGAAARLGLRRPPDVRTSDEVPVPLAFGLRTPVVILPAEAETWTAERRRTVLLHEFAHIRRGDLITHALGRVASALFWPHPLAWVAARRQRTEAERACDDLVLGQGLRPSEYAGHLIDIVRAAGRRPAPASAVPMARRSEFEGRLMAILDPALRRDPLRTRRAAPVVGIGALLLFPLAALAPAGTSPVPRVAEPELAVAIEAEPLVPSALDPVLAPDERHPLESDEQLRQQWTATEVRQALQDSPHKAKTPEARKSEAQTGKAQEAPPASRSRAVAALLTALRDPDAGVRLAALESLADLEDPSAAEGVRVALGDDNAGVRRSAARALGHLEDPRAVEALMRVLREDEDAEVRTYAAWALGQIGDRRAVPALVDGLRDANAEVREQAAWALGELDDPAAVPGLVSVVDDPDPEVREQAVWALGEIQDPRAVEALVSALGDASADVRRQAAWALGEFELRVAPTALRRALEDADPEVREAAAHTLGHIGDPATVPWLKGRLRDENRDVRREVVEALSEMEDPSAVDVLIEAMKDADAEVRKEAAAALGRGGKR